MPKPKTLSDKPCASAQTLLAFTLLARGHAGGAMDLFLPFLEQAAEGNVPGLLMRDNPFIVPLLRHAHERKAQRPFVEQVLHLLGAPLDPVAASSPSGQALTEREREVLRVMAEGASNKDIARRLFVSEPTVKTHVQRIMQKLNASSRTEAVARGRELLLL